MASLARWCLRHRGAVLAFWLCALVVLVALDGVAKPNYQNKFSLPNTQSTEALSLLQKDFPSVSGDTDQIVFHARTGTLVTPAIEGQVEAMLKKVSALPHVASVVSPLSPGGERQVSADRTVAYATVNFDEAAQNLPNRAINRVIDTAQAIQNPRLQVALGGQAVEAVQKQKSSSSELLGVVFALIVLLLVFGSIFSALLPLITALIAIGIGYAITGLLTHVFAIANFAPILGVLIGLGVGVDYALFIITRHRNGLRAGRSVEDSVANAINTAGRAVFFAGLTVCIALLGQFALGVSFLYGVAISAAATVGLTMLASITLLPALLGFFKLRVLSKRERKRLALTGPVSEHNEGMWLRWARFIERAPAVKAAASLAVVVIVAIPIFSLHLGLTDAGTDPAGSTTRQAYDLLAKGFGPGFSGPFDVVAEINSPADKATFAHVAKELARVPGVVRVSPPVASPNGKAEVATLISAHSPQSTQTSALLGHLRDHAIPSAIGSSHLRVLVGGVTAIQEDFAHVLASKLPLFVAVVVVLAFLLLMMVFRSLLIPFIASIMNLLSVGAALGIMSAVFGWGWGTAVLGLPGTSPIEVFVPVIMFSVLFGLSMDYEVFLVSRMHEEWLHTSDNRQAVTRGQAETGRVITAAAFIMILVFLSFLLGGTVVIDQFGVGLAGAIVVDAFIVRTFIVPATMHVFGQANWWLPPWLERILPRLNVEGPDETLDADPSPPPLEPVNA